MFVKKRVEIRKEFDSYNMALIFASGINFAGSREVRIKEIKEENGKGVVILEKLEISKS